MCFPNLCSSDDASDSIVNDMGSKHKSWKGLVWCPWTTWMKWTALDLKVYSCDPAKWIMNAMWLNLVEHSKFHPLSKAGEGTLTSLSNTCTTWAAAYHYQNEHCIQTAIKGGATSMYLTLLHLCSEDVAFKESSIKCFDRYLTEWSSFSTWYTFQF